MNEFKRTKGSWTANGRHILSKDHPIADVIIGIWGDPYVDLELTGGSLDRKCVPVIKMIEHGEISKEEGNANANLIASAPELLDALENLVIGIGMGWDLEGMTAVAQSAINKALGKEAVPCEK